MAGHGSSWHGDGTVMEQEAEATRYTWLNAYESEIATPPPYGLNV
jgi:hypothetical protein